MKRLPVVVLLAAGLGAGATALAQPGNEGRTPYELPEPAVTSAQVLHLAPAARCTSRSLVTLRITPPPGAVLGWVRVRAVGREVARLTGVPRAASATVRLPRRGGRVVADGETLGGQRLALERRYHACGSARPAPAPTTPGEPVQGGGES